MARWPGSTLRWAAITYSARRRAKRLGHQRAGRGDEAVDHDRLSPGGGASTTPAMPPISNPPTLASTSKPSLRIGPVHGAAPFHHGDLVRPVWPSSMPVPRPVNCGHRQAGQARPPRRSKAWCWRCPCRRCRTRRSFRPASRRPRCRPRWPRIAWSRVMAGPAAMLAVPRATFLSMILPGLRQRAQIGGNAHVDHHDPGPGHPRQGVDAGHARRRTRRPSAASLPGDTCSRPRPPRRDRRPW